MHAVPPDVSGVYQIRCIPTGKIYIGSAVNLRSRWCQHRSTLQRGEHRNPHLQQAWLKYGETNFEFSVLEYVSRDDLLAAEQRWINTTKCIDREIGFNAYPVAGSPGDANAKVWHGFVDPKGDDVVITNMEEFCRQNDLHSHSMRRLASGKSKLRTHKGWSHHNSVRQRNYIKTYEGYIDPEGNSVEPITNLAEFCRRHGLDNTHMLAVANGRICSHRGWTHVHSRTRKDSKTYTGFINPEGEQVTITNLAEFCRQYGLQPVKMHNVKSGKIRQHKGWTWRKEQDG